MNILQMIFSVKNEVINKRKYKVVKIFGLKMKFRLQSYATEQKISELFSIIKEQQTKIDEQQSYITACKKKLNILKPVFKYIKYAQYQINIPETDVQIKKFKNRGTIGINQTEKRTPRIIVSLTTFPERIGDVHYTVYSLLNQSVKPDKVILWLGEEQFPDREEDVSQELLDLKQHGLTIEFTRDIKSFKKLVPVLRQYPDEIIVTADDDIFYPKTWLEQLYTEYLENPNRIYAHRCCKALITENNELAPYRDWVKLIDDESSSPLNFSTTGGGVLYPPHSLYKDATNEELWTQLSPSSDENWFWTMAVINKKEIKVLKNPVNHIALVNVYRDCCFGKETTLARVNQVVSGVYNVKDMQLQSLVKHYPDMLKILKEASMRETNNQTV